MLHAMIAKKTFDIRHKTDGPDITDKQDQTKDALQQIVQPRAPAKIMFGKAADACKAGRIRPMPIARDKPSVR